MTARRAAALLSCLATMAFVWFASLASPWGYLAMFGATAVGLYADSLRDRSTREVGGR
jgi:hypothetical protein